MTKNNRRFRIITTVVAMCLTLCILVSGIWAATSLSFTGTASLSFNAKDVAATVAGSWYKIAPNGSEGTDNVIVFPGGTATTLSSGRTGYAYGTDFQSGSEYSDTVTIDNFEFEDLDDKLVLKIIVKNDFDAESAIKLAATLQATVQNPTGKDYVNVSVKAEGIDSDVNGVAQAINPQGHVTYTVTVSVNSDADVREELRKNGFAGVAFQFDLDVVRAAS